MPSDAVVAAGITGCCAIIAAAIGLIRSRTKATKEQAPVPAMQPTPVRGEAAPPQVPPAGKIPVRERNMLEIANALKAIPPLQRESYAKREYVGKRVDWEGWVCSIESWDKKHFEIKIHSPPTHDHHVGLLVPLSSRASVEPLREQDIVRYEGTITTCRDGYIEVEGVITGHKRHDPDTKPPTHAPETPTETPAQDRVYVAEKDGRTFVRESSPRDILNLLDTLPPLERKRYAAHAFAGEWVRWTGTVRTVGEEPSLPVGPFIIGLNNPPRMALDAYLWLSEEERPSVEPLREGDVIAFEGEIYKVEGNVMLRKGKITSVVSGTLTIQGRCS